jgi:hypothetical protein
MSFLKTFLNRAASIVILLIGGAAIFLFKASGSIALGIVILVVILAFFRKQLFGSIRSASLGKGVLVVLLFSLSVATLFGSIIIIPPYSWGVVGFAVGLALVAVLVLRAKKIWVLVLNSILVLVLTTGGSYLWGQRDVDLYGVPDVITEVQGAIQTFNEAMGGPTATIVVTSTPMPTVEPQNWRQSKCMRLISNELGAETFRLGSSGSIELIEGRIIPFDTTVNSIGYFLEYLLVTYTSGEVTSEVYVRESDLSSDPADVQCSS